MWLYRILFIRSPGNGHLGCSSFLAITNNAAVNIPVQVFTWTYVVFTLGLHT